MPKKTHPPKPIVLNPEQQAVVQAGAGVWAVQAGPGSGKSASIVNRYCRLIRDGVSPSDILAVTFTNGAAKSMRERAEAAIDVQKMDDRTCGWMTFHGLALSFCTKERENFGFKLAEFPLATEPVARKFIGEAARKFEVDPKGLSTWISLQKRNRVSAKEALKIAEKEGKNEKQALAYKLYDSKLRDNFVLDFDSLILEMVELLIKNKEVRARHQYEWLMCDESQDCDEIQFLLLKLLSEQHGNLMCVGDAGQSVYSFRGASSHLFLSMAEMFPGTQVLYLAKNHRSSRRIVDVCKTLGPIEDLASRFYTDNEEGSEVKVVGFPSALDEATSVTVAAREIDKSESAAVLSRTNRYLRSIEDQFANSGVPYHYLGRSGFWSQGEIRSVLAYLGIVTSLSDGNVKIALNSPFWPTQYLKKKVISDEIKTKQRDDPNKPSAFKLLQEYRSSDPNQVKGVSSFVHFLFGLRRYQSELPQRALQSLLNDLRVKDLYEEESTADNNPLENLQELVKIAGRYSSIKEFLDYTRRASQASKSKRGLAVGTCHAAKGLEWDQVYLIGVNDGHLPHSKAESLGDERNILFVGISRAKTDLTISYAGMPSQFLQPFLAKPEDALDKIFQETA